MRNIYYQVTTNLKEGNKNIIKYLDTIEEARDELTNFKYCIVESITFKKLIGEKPKK